MSFFPMLVLKHTWNKVDKTALHTHIEEANNFCEFKEDFQGCKNAFVLPCLHNKHLNLSANTIVNTRVYLLKVISIKLYI